MRKNKSHKVAIPTNRTAEEKAKTGSLDLSAMPRNDQQVEPHD